MTLTPADIPQALAALREAREMLRTKFPSVVMTPDCVAGAARVEGVTSIYIHV